MEGVFWSLADEALLADLLSSLNYHLYTELGLKIKSPLFEVQVELGWYCKTRLVEIYAAELRDAELLVEYWRDIANRVQQLVSDRFFLVIAQGYPGNFQTLLIEQVE